MKIALLQTDIAWAQPAANAEHVDRLLGDLPTDVDLVVLPEMWSTGFATTPDGIAEPADSPSLHHMQRWAAQLGAALCGSIAVCDGGRYVNRHYFVSPDGSVSHYDKHHLFTYGGEHLRYTAGDQAVIVNHCGVRIRLLTCYDLRFPLWSRNTAEPQTREGAYDVAIYVASWPTSRVDAWDTLLRARAIENQCYVVGVNRVGHDPQCDYPGSSALIDPYGRPTAQCGRGHEAVAIGRLDTDALHAFRRKFPVLLDADGGGVRC